MYIIINVYYTSLTQVHILPVPPVYKCGCYSYLLTYNCVCVHALHTHGSVVCIRLMTRVVGDMM